MTLPKNEWPWTLDDAVAAKITLWDGGKLGVVYHYPDEAIQMHAIGSRTGPPYDDLSARVRSNTSARTYASG
jgi:hypothetical protein